MIDIGGLMGQWDDFLLEHTNSVPHNIVLSLEIDEYNHTRSFGKSEETRMWWAGYRGQAASK